MTRPIPDGYHGLTIHIMVSPCSEAIDFYRQAFGAEELMRLPTPDGQILHAALRIGDSVMMLNDPMMGGKGPKELGGTNATCHLYVEDADAVYARAVELGATVTMPISDAFWGDRYGMIVDPFGQSWAIATALEDVSPEEMGRRAAELFK
jgi:PhnB protein